MIKPEFRAADLAAMLGTEIFDADDAALFLGLARNSIDYAAYRQRISYAQYGAKKLFTRTDLVEYRDLSARGRQSRLTEKKPNWVK